MKLPPIETQLAIIREYQTGRDKHSFMTEYGVGWRTLDRILSAHNVASNPCSGRGQTNAASFDLDFFARRTPTVAYWAGFTMADGNISEMIATHRYVLMLHQDDEEHLRTFCDAIALPHSVIKPASGNKLAVRFAYSRLAEQLRPWGVVPAKSYNFVEPDVPNDLLPHYLRGWFDGDGYIGHHLHKERFRVTGNMQAMDWYGEALRCIGYNGTMTFERPAGKVWGKIAINGRHQVARVARLLYHPGLPALERKWQIGLRLCEDLGPEP